MTGSGHAIRDASEDNKTLTKRLVGLLDVHAEESGFPFAPGLCGLEVWHGDCFAGGLQFQVNYNWCFVKLLAVEPEKRGNGVGSDLLGALETRMADARVIGIWLDTYGFQAARFYERHGYREFGRLSGRSSEQDRIFMNKTLGEGS